MRRSFVLVAAGVALAATAGVAQADVTDVLAVPALPGVLTVTGAGAGLVAGLGTAAAPNQAANQTIGTASGSIAGSELAVLDATGSTAGWDVTATYKSLASGQLQSLMATATIPGIGAPAAVTDLGASNITVTGATTQALAGVNSTAGVANPVLLSDQPLTSPVRMAQSAGDGRGTTLFNTSYKINLPAKTSAAATIYTGTVVYTVAPHVAVP